MDADRQLLAILACITDGVVHLDRNWHYTYLNPQAAAMFGRKPEDLVGKHIWTEFPEGVGQPFHLAYERALREQRVICIQDYYAPWDRWFENRVYPSADGVTILFQDITEARRREAALLQAQKLESLGVLASGIAHDFNNLLGALQGHLDLMTLDLAEDSPLKARAETMAAVVDRAAQLVRQMLAYAGRSDALPRPMDANRAIADMASLLAVSIPKGVTLHLDLTPEAPWIHADPALFQQVVMNLLTNATDAIQDPAGEIRIGTRPARLDAATLDHAFHAQGLQPGDHLLLEVEDTGCGMDEAVLARIFDPFFTTKAQGRGLGLSAMRGILRSHGAGLAIQSRPGEGTCFRICFPVAPRPAPEAAQTTAPALLPLRVPGPVLVVDDEDALRLAAASFFRTQGLTVLEAPDGQAALDALAARTDIALVLMDLTMPRLGGLEALARLRTTRPTLPVILTSGFTSDPALQTLPADPAATFLTKPFRFQDLHRCVHTFFPA